MSVFNHIDRYSNRTAGNALWLILLAIVLIGGLTALVTRTGSQSEDTGSTEKASIAASKIISYANEIRNGVEMLKSRGCSEDEISFENTVNTTESYINPNAPADKSCHLFLPQGAGLTYQIFDSGFFVSPNTYGGRPLLWTGTGIKNMGTTKADLVFYFNNLSKNICVAINRQLGITNTSGAPPAETTTVATGNDFFKGVYAGVNSDPIGDTSELTGKKAGCFYNTGAQYQFFTLLIAR